MAAFSYPIIHYSRHVPWGGATGDADIIMFGPDYTSGTFQLAIAAAAGSAALISLTKQAAGTQGVSATFEDPFTHPITSEVGSAMIIRPQVDEASFEALVWGSDPTAPLELYYDLLMTPTGLPQRAVCFGTFTLYPGVSD